MTAWKNKLLATSLLALVTGLVIHTGGIAGSARIPMHPQVAAPDSTQVGLIYQLQAAFHHAKTNQDIELMMSLWDANATLTVQGNANQTFVGSQQIRSFWETVKSADRLAGLGRARCVAGRRCVLPHLVAE
jgi:hypothetical protein